MNWLTSRKVCVIEYHGYDTLVVVKYLSSSAVCIGVNVAQSFSFLSIAFCGPLFFRFDHCIVFPPVYGLFFRFDHCIVFPPVYGFLLPFRYPQSFQ